MSYEERHVDCEVCGEGFTGDETISAGTKTHIFNIDNLMIGFDACRHHTDDELRAEAENQVATYKASVAALQAEPGPEPSHSPQPTQLPTQPATESTDMEPEWSLKKVANSEELTNDDIESLTTKRIARLSHELGLNKITRTNYLEFHWRQIKLKAACNGYNDSYSLAAIERRIGMTTNAVPKTAAAFEKYCRQAHADMAAGGAFHDEDKYAEDSQDYDDYYDDDD